MSIEVKKVAENLYTVLSKAPEWRGGEEWSRTQPIDGGTLVNELAQRGFHPQDICDAMDEADPQWKERLA